MPRMVGVSEAIDSMVEANAKGPRPHMGASQIGKPCDRRLVYGFRHAAHKQHSGRMLRLFSRGHKEEITLVQHLRDIGFEVREFAERLCYHEGSNTYFTQPWDEPVGAHSPAGAVDDVSDIPAHHACAELCGVKVKQWAFSDIGGHHAGSTDGQFMNPADNLRQFPAIPAGVWGGLEFKTYNAKSFVYLQEQGSVRAAKPEHYSQMQEYMHYMGLPFCLYIAICKNDDTLYDEVVAYDQAEALRCIDRARVGIAARQLPPRISDRSTNIECKFCDYHKVCHFGEPLIASCRTCKNVSAITEGDNADWFCSKWQAIIPKKEVPKGCPSWQPITD
jgi:hypothetical protein